MNSFSQVCENFLLFYIKRRFYTTPKASGVVDDLSVVLVMSIQYGNERDCMVQG